MFSIRHVRKHLFTIKKKRLNDLIRSRMEGYWTDKLLYYTHNKTSYP